MSSEHSTLQTDELKTDATTPASLETGIEGYVRWFRHAAPYINMHRGKVFVIMFNGEAVESDNFKNLIHDFALLKSLGIKLVLVHGARPQIDANLAKQKLTTPIVKNLRVTTREALQGVLDAVGSIRLQIEALLTMGLSNSPMYGSRIDVVSGNFVVAKPYGVRGGVDYQLTGAVRSIDTEAIQKNLDNDHIVLLGSIGYSTTGEVFNLLAEQVAVKAAVALQAEKLILIGDEGVNLDITQGKREILPRHAHALLAALTEEEHVPVEFKRHLTGSAKACEQGVNRSHIISYQDNGALLKELFTREGVGTLVSENTYEDIHTASIEDVGGLIALLTPLEEKGILVKRSRERLEMEIDHFIVTKREGVIVGCAALYPISHETEQAEFAEVACVAVHPDYRNANRGEKLLSYLESQAKQAGISKLFILTTQTAHWFMEQGFAAASISDLPEKKQALYNHQRNSQVYIKPL